MHHMRGQAGLINSLLSSCVSTGPLTFLSVFHRAILLFVCGEEAKGEKRGRMKERESEREIHQDHSPLSNLAISHHYARRRASKHISNYVNAPFDLTEWETIPGIFMSMQTDKCRLFGSSQTCKFTTIVLIDAGAHTHTHREGSLLTQVHPLLSLSCSNESAPGKGGGGVGGLLKCLQVIIWPPATSY